MNRFSNSNPIGWPVDSDWSNFLRETLEADWFRSLQEFLAEERRSATIYPAREDVFRAFQLTSFAETKVVILGQDPYHGPDQAQGLSFSVRRKCPSPPSLKNIFRELVDDLGLPAPSCGELTAWAQQGVLLLNTVLTVREGEANSHSNRGWERFTDLVIQTLGQQSERSIAFVLWGKSAERKRTLIGNNHYCITAPHPSPLSAHRGFFGSRPFSKINFHLQRHGYAPIDWRLN
jgi:uracil-DNA glycosylase